MNTSKIDVLTKAAEESAHLHNNGTEPSESSIPVKQTERSSDEQQKMSFADKIDAILAVDEYSSIVSWLPTGKSFAITNKERFIKEVLPRFFKDTKFESLQRRLKRWGFRAAYKTDADNCTKQLVYTHDLFIKNRPELRKMMSGKAGNNAQVRGHHMQQSQHHHGHSAAHLFDIMHKCNSIHMHLVSQALQHDPSNRLSQLDGEIHELEEQLKLMYRLKVQHCMTPPSIFFPPTLPTNNYNMDDNIRTVLTGGSSAAADNEAEAEFRRKAWLALAPLHQVPPIEEEAHEDEDDVKYNKDSRETYDANEFKIKANGATQDDATDTKMSEENAAGSIIKEACNGTPSEEVYDYKLKGVMSSGSSLTDMRNPQCLLDMYTNDWTRYTTTATEEKQELDSAAEGAIEHIQDGSQEQKPKNTGRWTADEHRLFLKGLQEYGKNWTRIATEYVQTRTVLQCRSHAQKYFQQLDRTGANGDNNGQDIHFGTKVLPKEVTTMTVSAKNSEGAHREMIGKRNLPLPEWLQTSKPQMAAAQFNMSIAPRHREEPVRRKRKMTEDEIIEMLWKYQRT